MTDLPNYTVRVSLRAKCVRLSLCEIDMSVKMRTTCTWTERPYEALL